MRAATEVATAAHAGSSARLVTTRLASTVGRVSPVASMEVSIAVIKRMAVEGIRTAAIKHPAVVPVDAPSVPAPAVSEERPDAKSDSEAEIRPTNAPPRIEARPVSNRISVDKVRIVFRHVNHVWVRRLNHHGRSLSGHGLLRRGLQIPRVLSFLTHVLNGLHAVGLLVVISVAELRGPGEILVQIRQNCGELGQSLHARIPILLVDLIA